MKVEELSQSVETIGNPNATQETDEGSIPDQDKAVRFQPKHQVNDSSPFDQQSPDEPTESNNPIDGQGNRTQNENNNRSNRTQIDANGQFALSSNPPNIDQNPQISLERKHIRRGF